MLNYCKNGGAVQHSETTKETYQLNKKNEPHGNLLKIKSLRRACKTKYCTKIWARRKGETADSEILLIPRDSRDSR